MGERAATRGSDLGESPIGDAGGAQAATHRSDGRESSVEDTIARLGSAQHGLVTHRELIAAGVSRRAISRRVDKGALHPQHRGVYAAGHTALTRQAIHLAAVLACGAGAVLSHFSAAIERGLLVLAGTAAIDVTVPGRRARPGIRTHEAPLAPADVRIRDGIPITSPARTLIDLAAVATLGDLERAVNEARVLRLLRADELRPPAGHRGAARLRALLVDATFTRSEAERRLVSLVVKAQLPRPRTNARAAGFEVDALWPDHRLIVEVDGYATHAGRRSFENDRHRDAVLQAAGYRVIRLTWRQLTGRPEMVAARLAALLARAAT